MARQCRRQENTEGRPTDKGQRTITWARVILSPTRLCNILDVARTAKSTGCLRSRDKRKHRVGIGVPWETWTRAQKRGCWKVAPRLTFAMTDKYNYRTWQG